ncbi:aspartyl protease family protein 1-like isoform X1 [Vigna radiata var. radiata]|uniref:Aspartyl protease family protein 1-like isoform X1 n=1 Tax=Vigna radiata var. radiata TaxID=3916 RepID=A0A3Q0F5X9_VIGRR|nr:aspartyl protease family protein 1-like isoform X1 [Vigna radiata var. radiata]
MLSTTLSWPTATASSCGRKLSQIYASLAFSDGNSTFRISSLGLYLFFSLILLLSLFKVEIGTSAVKFMVALDTESDLFWVPCDCTRCAATDSPTFASYFPNCRYQHTMTIKLLKLGKIDVYM